MARRKASPNIPADTLARARAQAALNPLPVEETTTPTHAEEAPVPVARSTNKRLEQARLERNRKKGELDQETIREMLLHPTTFPTVEQLSADYAYVVRDLRNMAILSAALVTILLIAETLFI